MTSLERLSLRLHALGLTFLRRPRRLGTLFPESDKLSGAAFFGEHYMGFFGV